MEGTRQVFVKGVLNEHHGKGGPRTEVLQLWVQFFPITLQEVLLRELDN